MCMLLFGDTMCSLLTMLKTIKYIREIMKIKTLIIMAASLLFINTSANAIVIPLTGETVDGAEFNILSASNTNTAAVTDVSFNLVYDAGDNDSNFSWGSELVLELTHLSSGLFVQIGTFAGGCAAFGIICDFDLMWGDFGGLFNAAGSVTFSDDILDGSGGWELLIADSFDDAGIDGRFLDGSFISINQAVTQTPVPAPVSLLMICLSLSGMLLVRRRTKL